MTTEKKIVRYVAGSLDVFELWGKKRASLTPIDHPNQMDVVNGRNATTSSVLNYDEVTGLVETKNTIYLPGVVMSEGEFGDSGFAITDSEYGTFDK